MCSINWRTYLHLPVAVHAVCFLAHPINLRFVGSSHYLMIVFIFSYAGVWRAASSAPNAISSCQKHRGTCSTCQTSTTCQTYETSSLSSGENSMFWMFCTCYLVLSQALLGWNWEMMEKSMPGTRWISVLKLFCCYTAVHVSGFLIVLTCLLRIYVDQCMMYILLFMLLICTRNDSNDATSTCMCSILSKNWTLFLSYYDWWYFRHRTMPKLQRPVMEIIYNGKAMLIVNFLFLQ